MLIPDTPPQPQRGVDLGLASQIHFFIPSLKLGHTGKAFLDSKPRVYPAVSTNECPHPIGSCLLVWQSALIFQSHLSLQSAGLPTKPVQCLCSMTASLAGPIDDEFGCKISQLFFFSLVLFVLFFCFLGLNPKHMEVQRLGVELQLKLLATATAMPDPSQVCDLHRSLQQHRIINPLSEARDWTLILMSGS